MNGRMNGRFNDIKVSDLLKGIDLHLLKLPSALRLTLGRTGITAHIRVLVSFSY
jgi:hypothetical protein